MKDCLFEILVVLLTPVYFIITILKIISYITEPFTELITEIIETMTEFWKNIFLGRR